MAFETHMKELRELTQKLEQGNLPLEEAVQLCSQKAHAGDAVLMSPACASLDMFKNYAHRAEVFCHAVAALAEEKGSSLEVQP